MSSKSRSPPVRRLWTICWSHVVPHLAYDAMITSDGRATNPRPAAKPGNDVHSKQDATPRAEHAMDLADTCKRRRPVHVGMKGVGAVEHRVLKRECCDVGAGQEERPVLDRGPETPGGENRHVWR